MKATCPHPDCAKQIGARVFACKQHWFALPNGLRNRIWSAARAVWADMGSSQEKRDRLYAVHAEAIECWKAEVEA